jgi:hypothetical protein
MADAPPSIVSARVIPWELEGAYGSDVAITWSDRTHEAYPVGNRLSARREIRRLTGEQTPLKLVPPAKDCSPLPPARKFRIGQSVYYRTRASRGQFTSHLLCIVVKLLPARADGELEYQIRNTEDWRDLVVGESNLRAV